MNKAVLIGIITAVIIGIGVTLYVSIISLNEDIEEGSIGLTPGNTGEGMEQETTPQGRDLAIEFKENMGLSAP